MDHPHPFPRRGGGVEVVGHPPHVGELEPQGIVEVSDYEALLAELTAKLTTMTDHEGRPLGPRVFRPKMTYRELRAVTPDLIVYRQAPADVLLERIARRGIEYEQQIERRYLERLTEGYARFFLEYDAAPVLIVNAAEIDPIGNEADYQALLAEIVRPRKGRHYFNPLKSLL